MIEPASNNPYAGMAGSADPAVSPYLRSHGADFDLDAAAPRLGGGDARRVNRKALASLLGIVALLMLITAWAMNGVSTGDEKAARPREENVSIPELPQEPAARPVPPAAAAIDLQDVPVASAELPPLPPDPVRTVPREEAPGTPLQAMPSHRPSLVERRMGIQGPSDGASEQAPDVYARAVLAGLHAQQDENASAVTPAPAAHVEAASAQYLQHPDTLMVRGTYLRCVLETHIVTDVPGYTSCILTEPAYSLNGRSLLLPQGSKILGHYSSEASGPRVAVVWDRILTPSGIDVNMSSPGVDNLGGAGHPGHLDAHWASRVASALMISLVSDAFKYAGAKNGPSSTTVTTGLVTEAPFESNTARTVQRLADQALDQGMRRPATVTINQGTVVNVYVARDIDFSDVSGRR